MINLDPERFDRGTTHLTFKLLAILIALFSAVTVHAQNVDILSQNPQGPDLGNVVQPPVATSVWRIDPDTGEANLVSGNAVRLTSGPSSPPQIAIQCPTNACRNATLTAAFAPSLSGAGTIVGLTPGTVTAHGLTLLTVSGAGTPHLLMTFVAGNVIPASVTFPLGMTIRVSSGRGGGPNYGYTLSVTLH